MTLHDVVARFNTTPFLFAGSGITRRYYDLPDWEGLLKEFSSRINEDRFAYQSYHSRASGAAAEQNLLPKIAELIQKDFDAAWFARPEIRHVDERGLQLVESGVSPFKVEIAAFLAEKSSVLERYTVEMGKLNNISKKNLAGIITTNYDDFFEKKFKGYKSFVGQDELVFSPIQGIAEIYKIHGSVSRPETLVITESDYEVFNSKGKYLAAKLMTIFMEYPIIFIGYSLTDPNILNILKDIVVCLPKSKIAKLQERFVFVDYVPGTEGVSVSSHSVDLEGRLLSMTKLTLSDFSLLYDALAAKKAAMPVKLLRRFKEDIYTYAVTSKPGPLLRVTPLDSESIDEDQLVVSIGLSNKGEYGLRSLVDEEIWYRNIVTGELDSSDFTSDQLLEFAYEDIAKKKGINGFFPLFKYLASATRDFPDIQKRLPETFDALATSTGKNNRHSTEKYTSVQDLCQKEGENLSRIYRLLCCFPEEKMDADQLGSVLRDVFENDKNALSSMTSEDRANVKRLIRMYDYLKWGKKEP